jgi:hypothetical protein
VVAEPAEKIERSARDKLLAEVRATLARLRQAGMSTEELLTVMQFEVLEMDGGGRENDDE